MFAIPTCRLLLHRPNITKVYLTIFSGTDSNNQDFSSYFDNFLMSAKLLFRISSSNVAQMLAVK